MENPTAPATSRQLWALFCATKKDHRNLGLTKEQASKLLEEANANREAKPAKESFADLWAKAVEAGNKAVVEMDSASIPAIPLRDGHSIPAGHGLCGFAWIHLRDARKAFAKWAKDSGVGSHDSYAGGVTIWISQFQQSMIRKETFASAAAEVLRKAGVDAVMRSRMD